jgi:SAM-dependent methyltransferase
VRVADLDRDMSAVFPTGLDRDSEFLYDRMREVTYELLRAKPDERVLDAAAGLGSDGQNLAERGLRVLNAEPSETLNELKQMVAEKGDWKDYGNRTITVRAWAERLPFPTGTFRAAYCKGSLDHFDDPAAGIAEMARVTAADGRVVLSVVNMESLGCRLMAWRDLLAGRRRRNPARRHYDAPPDHYTRYDAALLRQEAASFLHIEEWRGVSLFWGISPWAALISRLSERNATRLLRAADYLANRFPPLADVVILSGHPLQDGDAL